MIAKKIKILIKSDGSYLDTILPPITANEDGRTIVQVIAPFPITDIVSVNYSIRPIQATVKGSYLVPTGKFGKDVLADDYTHFQTVADWNVFEIPINAVALEYISKYRAGLVLVSFTIKQLQTPYFATNYLGLFSDTNPIPTTTYNDGDYFIANEYNFTAHDITWAKGDYAYFYNGKWNKGKSVLKASTPSIELPVDPSLKDAPQLEYDEDVALLLANDLGLLTQRVSQSETDIESAENDINDIENDVDDLETEIGNIKDGTTIVKKAEQDANGNVIADTYATKSQHSTAISEIDKIKDGTTVVKKAERDANNNVIATHYETKIDATSKLLTKVDKTQKIIGIDLQDDILLTEFKTALGNATQSVAGLLSAEDKTHLDGLVALLENSDGNTVVDTIGEILAIFQNYPEGADLVTVLNGKVDKVAGKGLSQNDFTDIDKNKVDLSYTHSEIVDGSNPHNTKFVNIADKPTTRDGYGITDVYTKPETYTQLEINNLLDNLSSVKGLKSTLLTPTELVNGSNISTNLLTNNGAYIVFTATDTSTGEIDSDTVPASSIITGKKFVFFDNQEIVFTIGETNSTFETSEDITLKINLLYLDSENIQAVGVDFDGSLTSYLENQENVQSAINKIDEELRTTNDNSSNHITDINNPHSVTKEQVGLGNVDNTSDLDKPISTLTQNALNNKSNVGHTHTKSDITDFAHNHDDRYYTEEETNTLLNAKLNTSLKGAVNGLAELGSDGKVLSGQLPSYVDDVLEYANLTAFPANGESGKIYVALDTNKTYRWSGSGYTEISASLALGETSSTAGRGDWTKTAHDHTGLTNNPHSVTKAQVGLSNVDNTSDANKPVSTAQQTALNGKENSFTKNTAFNKNFGTTAGTVAQGNHNHDTVYEPKNTNIQTHIGQTNNPHSVTKTQVGLGNADNTSDLNKPISTATQSALNDKVDKVTGKGLSTNDYTTTEKNKLAGIASGAEVNVQSNWNATSGDALILNKPYIPNKVSDLTNDTGYITGYTETDPIFTAWNKSTGISITKSQVSDLIEATQALSGLMSATDKTRLDTLHALLEEDTENSVVDSINEVLAIFNNYPEGADLVTALAGKVDKVTGKGLSTNDLTNTLKSNYDTAYSWGNHAVEGYLKAITKAMVETVLTGTITSHNHNGVYEPAFSKNTAFNKNFGTSLNTVAQGNHLHTGVYEPANSNIQSHISSTSNPHNVSKSQVGLGNVDNTSDGTKYVQGLRETRANVNTKIWTGTEAQYDAIGTKDANTLYFITE